MLTGENILQESLRETNSLLMPASSAVSSDYIPSAYVSEVEMFGEHSRLSGNLIILEEPSTYLPILTSNVIYSLTVLAGFLFFCLIIHLYRTQIATVLNILRGNLYMEKLLDDQNYFFEIFLRRMVTSWLLMLAVSVIKSVDINYGEELFPLLPVWITDFLTIFVFLVLLLIWIFQTLLIKTVGLLTNCERFTNRIIKLRKLIFSFSALLIIPTALLFALSRGDAAYVLYYLIIAELSMLFIFLLVRSYILFKVQKISILTWFLYLCGVEIFPVSLFVLIALRNM